MARVDHELTATRVDHKLTWSELVEFVRAYEGAIDPGAWIKVQTSVRGYARSVKIVPDPDRQDPGGGPDGQ
jgi:hypothetical protein